MTFRSSVPIAQGQMGSPSGDIAIGNVEDAGTSVNVPRADHTHAFPAVQGETAKLAETAGDGALTAAARADHVHPHPASDHEAGGFADLTAVFAGLDAAKRLDLAGPTDAAATAGTATALPAAPAGYLETVIEGVTYKIPYYPV